MLDYACCCLSFECLTSGAGSGQSPLPRKPVQLDMDGTSMLSTQSLPSRSTKRWYHKHTHLSDAYTNKIYLLCCYLYVFLTHSLKINVKHCVRLSTVGAMQRPTPRPRVFDTFSAKLTSSSEPPFWKHQSRNRVARATLQSLCRHNLAEQLIKRQLH